MKVNIELLNLYGVFKFGVGNKPIKTVINRNNYTGEMTKKSPIFSKKYFQKLPMTIQQYLSKINSLYLTGNAREHVYRGDLQDRNFTI